MTITQTVCEQCGKDHNEVRYAGQVCEACLQKFGPTVYVVKDSEGDDDRYLPMKVVAEFFDTNYYGEWYEFNFTEYDDRPEVKADWDSMGDIDATTIDSLRETVTKRMEFLKAFWQRHTDILKARDERMNGWSQVKAGEPKPIHWLNIPDFEVPEIEVAS